MKFNEIKKLINKKITTKELKKIILKITPAEFKKEMSKKGSIINILNKKIK